MKKIVFENSNETFGNCHAAVDEAMRLGFTVGGACAGLPLVCYKATEYDRVEKWRNLTREERANAPARIVFPTMDQRNGHAILFIKDSDDEVFPRVSQGEW